MNKTLEQVTAYWQRLSRREQLLAVAVSALLAIGIAGMLVRGAINHLKRLDTRIATLQEDIVNSTYQIEHRQEVQAQFAEVAAQHSSEWSEAEIHDRLRQEIYRLAQKVPPPLNEEGVPTKVTTAQGTLVNIPTLGEGSLSEGGEDYREYSLDFTIPRASFNDTIAFLERLKNSPQSLRIDALDIKRNPTQTPVRASIDITRTVVDGVEADSLPDAPPEFQVAENTGDPELDPAAWQSTNCALAVSPEHAYHGETALKAEADQAGGEVYYVRNLDAGAGYDLYVDATAFGPARFTVAGDQGPAPFGNGEKLRDDGTPYRYHVQFTVPGDQGATKPIRVPVFVLEESGAKVFVSRVVLRKAMV